MTPSSHSVIEGASDATAADVDRVAELAAQAFRSFRDSSNSQRANLLRMIADGIEALGSDLVECVHFETALPAGRIESERTRTCAQLRMFADLAEKDSWRDLRTDPSEPDRQPLPRPEVRSLLRPLGPIAVFGAGNFPLAFSVAGGDTAAALAVGCPVIVKAHPAHPGTSALVGRVIQQALAAGGLPAGVFSLLFDSGHDVAVALVRHSAVKAAAFTGSRTGGLALWRAALERPVPIPVFAEMSSVNPVFLLPQALQAKGEAIAVGLHASLTVGIGQFCTKPGLVFVQDSAAARRLLESLAEKVRTTPPGTMLTPAIAVRYQADIRSRTDNSGARLLATTNASGTQVPASIHFTDSATFLGNPVLAEEIFGPCTLIVTCDSAADMIRCANALSGQLTATLWADATEWAHADDLLSVLELKVGRLVMNGFPTGVEVGAATTHGGPFPATTDSRFTSVGTRSILRFVRPVAYQNFPEALLPKSRE